MDIVNHFELKRRPFQLSGEETAYRSEPFLAARGAIADAAMAWTSPIVMKGAPGTGKSVLLAELGRHLNARDRKSVIFSTPALATAADFATLDVALVDEADSASPELLAQLVGVASDLGTVLVLAGLDPPLASPPALTVTLGAMGPQDAYDFLLTAAQRSGRPDLFRPAALDPLVAASHGVPRVLKLLASAAMLESMLDDAKAVELRHAERAIENKSPLPRAPEPVESAVAVAAPAAVSAAVPEPELPTARAAPDAWLNAETDDEPVPAAAIPLPVYFRPRDPADVDLPPEAEYEFEEPRSRRFGSARGAVAAVLALILVGGGAVALGGAQLGLPSFNDMLGQSRPDTSLPVAAVAPEPALPPASDPVEQAAISPDLESAAEVPLSEEAPAPELAAADARLVPQPAAEADDEEEEAPAKSPAEEAAEIADAQRGGVTLVPGVTPPPSQLRIPPGYRPSAARFPSLSAAAEAGLPLAPGTAPK